MHHALRTTSQTIAVRSGLAGAEVTDRLRARLVAVSDDERGSQAAEYAMVGGVGAAACAGLVTILKNGDILERLVKALVGALVTFLKGWF